MGSRDTVSRRTSEFEGTQTATSSLRLEDFPSPGSLRSQPKIRPGGQKNIERISKSLRQRTTQPGSIPGFSTYLRYRFRDQLSVDGIPSSLLGLKEGKYVGRARMVGGFECVWCSESKICTYPRTLRMYSNKLGALSRAQLGVPQEENKQKKFKDINAYDLTRSRTRAFHQNLLRL
jgi:hypothetical protein